MLYKSLRRLSLVLSLALLWAGIAIAQEPSLFLVEDVKVDVTASNAIKARDQAFDAAQKKAYALLAERLLSEGATGAKTLDTATISTLIKDYEVTNEKLSSIRYIGTYTFRFDKNAVRALFTGSGQSYTDVQSTPLLILPFYQKETKTDLWSQNNVWMRAWNRSTNSGTLVPLIVPIGDIKDVQDIQDQQALNYNENKLQSMLRRYNASEAVLLIAQPDPHLSLIDKENQPATGRLTVNIYRTDQNRPEFAGRFTLEAQEGQTLSDLMDQAVLRVQKTLREDWKERTMVNTAENGILEAIVPIRSLSDWTSIQRRLNRTSGIQNIMVQSLSPQKAHIKIAYQGNQQRLILALNQSDLALSKSTPSLEQQNRLMVNTPYILTNKSFVPNMKKPNFGSPYSQKF